MPDITATIANLDALEEGATQGPWEAFGTYIYGAPYPPESIYAGKIPCLAETKPEPRSERSAANDATFIITLRNNYKAMRAHIQQQAEEIERLSKRAEAAERDLVEMADGNSCDVCEYGGWFEQCQVAVHHSMSSEHSCFKWRGPQPAEEGR